MEYLTVEDLLRIHSAVIDESGGAHGLRDSGLLQSAVAVPQQTMDGQDVYPDMFTKAATYIRGLSLNHAFVDGNKRTAITAAFIFLELQGKQASIQPGDIERFVVRVVTKKLSIVTIAGWLKQHTVPG